MLLCHSTQASFNNNSPVLHRTCHRHTFYNRSTTSESYKVHTLFWPYFKIPLQPHQRTTAPSTILIMAPTMFPRFTELPLELQTMVWQYAIRDACASYHPDLTTMNIIADFSRDPCPPCSNHRINGVPVSYYSMVERCNLKDGLRPVREGRSTGSTPGIATLSTISSIAAVWEGSLR